MYKNLNDNQGLTICAQEYKEHISTHFVAGPFTGDGIQWKYSIRFYEMPFLLSLQKGILLRAGRYDVFGNTFDRTKGSAITVKIKVGEIKNDLSQCKELGTAKFNESSGLWEFMIEPNNPVLKGYKMNEPIMFLAEMIDPNIPVIDEDHNRKGSIIEGCPMIITQ